MILTVHPDHDFRDMTSDKLIPFTRNVASLMTTNAGIFIGSAALVASAITQVDLLETKNNAYLANPKMYDASEIQRKVVVKILNKLNKIVDITADGDAGIIDLSGFTKTESETTPGHIPGKCVFHDCYPEGKGGYYVQINSLGRKTTYIFIICALDAVVTFAGNQVTISKGPFSIITDTHPHAEFANLPSGDQKLIVVALNLTGFGQPTAPTTISVP